MRKLFFTGLLPMIFIPLCAQVIQIPKDIKIAPITKYVLSNDFLMVNMTNIAKAYENTLKVTVKKGSLIQKRRTSNNEPPSVPSYNYSGTMHVLTGDRPGVLFGRNFTYSVEDDVVKFETVNPFRYKYNFDKFLTADDYSATDNHLVLLPDNSLLALKMGTTKRLLDPKPEWWDIGTMDAEFGAAPGQRGITYLLQSKDTGKTWTEVGLFDASLIINGGAASKSFDGTLGYPRNLDAKSVDKYYIGGNDRPELYYDRLKKRLYLSAWGAGGINDYKLVPADDAKKLKDLIVISYTLYSDDLGKTWNVMDQFGGNPVPLVMTSTTDGRFFEAYQAGIGGSVCIRYNTKADETSLVSPVVIDSEFFNNLLRPDSMAFMTDKPWIPQITIARLGNSRIRIAYNGMTASGQQVIKTGIFQVFSDKAGDYKFTPGVTIAAHKKGYSATYPVFIEPDINLPGNASGYAALYWVESNRSKWDFVQDKWWGTPAQDYAARYLVFDPANEVVTKGYLSVKNDLPRYWNDISTGQGDYYTGGFFWAADRLNFVAQWTEKDGVHGNVITVKPSRSGVRGISILPGK